MAGGGGKKQELGSLASILGGDEQALEKDIQETFDFIERRVKRRDGDIFDAQLVALGVLEELTTQIRENVTGEGDEDGEEGEDPT